MQQESRWVCAEHVGLDPVCNQIFAAAVCKRNWTLTYSLFFIIKYFKTSSLQLCFAYKGMLKDEVGVKFTYRDSQGKTITENARIKTLFTKGHKSVKTTRFNLSDTVCKPLNQIAAYHCLYFQMELQMHGPAEFPADRIYWKQIQSAGVLPLQRRVWCRFLCGCCSLRKETHHNWWKWYKACQS